MANKKRYKPRKQSNNRLLGWVALLFVVLIGPSIFSPQFGWGSAAIFLVPALVGTLVVGLGFVVYWFLREQKTADAYKAVRLADIDGMKGEEFEKYIAHLYRKMGYKTRLTPKNDFGTDIIAQKGDEKLGIQTKRQKGRVSNKAVQEALAGATHWECNKWMVVTNSDFTLSAKIQAVSCGCELVDRKGLGEMILEFTEPAQ